MDSNLWSLGASEVGKRQRKSEGQGYTGCDGQDSWLSIRRIWLSIQPGPNRRLWCWQDQYTMEVHRRYLHLHLPDHTQTQRWGAGWVSLKQEGQWFFLSHLCSILPIDMCLEHTLKYGVLFESNKLSLCFVRSTPLPEIVIAFADILLHVTETEIYKIEHGCCGNCKWLPSRQG